MPRKKKTDWRRTQADLQIHTKMGRERTITEIGNAYWGMYPGRARWITRMIKELNKVSKNADGSFTDAKNRTMFCEIRVPQELMCFLRRWIPDFGYDSADIDLLRKCWPDLAPRKDRRKKTRWALRDWNAGLSTADTARSCEDNDSADRPADQDSPRQCSDDNEELRGGAQEVPEQPAPALPA